MKSYCKNCETIQPSSFRPCTDVVTGVSYEDLCCDSCHYIVATIEEREALAQPAPLPVQPEQPKEKSTLVKLIEEKIVGMTPTECAQFMRDRATLAQLAQEPDALTIAYQSGYYDGKKAALAQPVQKPVALPCCGADASAVKWNPYNRVVQCHSCGQVYHPNRS